MCSFLLEEFLTGEKSALQKRRVLINLFYKNYVQAKLNPPILIILCFKHIGFLYIKLNLFRAFLIKLYYKNTPLNEWVFW